MRHSGKYLKAHLDTVFMIEPNDLGSTTITRWYRYIVSHLKYMPFLYVIPITLFVSIALYVVFGSEFIRLATYLQYGF